MGSWIWFLFALLLSWIPRLRACTRTFLRDAHGVIGDGPGEHTPNSVCEWFISPEDPSLKYITIEFQELSTECAYDYLFILDGNGSLLASLSGSGSERGVCTDNATCGCDEGFTGPDCSIETCPDGCKPGGKMSGEEAVFVVPPDLRATIDTFFSPRTSHSSIVLENSIYFYGGYNLRYVLRDLISYDFETWKKIEPQNNISWPPPLYGHAAVELDSGFVLFGGKDNHHIPSSQEVEFFGEFSSSMFTLQLSDWTWKTVEPRNGKMTDLRVTGHMADLARFSRLSDRIWVYDIKKRKWSELESAGDKDRPPERAYHAAVVIGDYMVIFGGYSHRHNKVEICYDKEIYFYHLGCHSWVSKNILDEGAVQHRNYPEREGLFGASVAVKKPNIIVYSGGYKGSVSGNVWAFTFPFALSIPNNKKVCSKYGSSSMCKANPECGWCSTTGICYPRTSTSNCSIKGLLPSLLERVLLINYDLKSVVGVFILKLVYQDMQPLILAPLKEKFKRDSAAKLTTPNQCTRENFKSGITLFKYSNPPNETYPDEVSIINKTEAEYMPFLNEVLPSSYRRSREEYILRIRGSVHIPHHHYSSSYSLNGSSDDDKIEEERNNLKWPESGSPIILKPGTSYQIDFSATALFESSMVLNGFFQPPLELSLKSGIDDEQIMPQVFGKDFLRPFRGDGSCLSYKNCFACTADTLCGWCSVHNECLARGDRSVEDRCNDNFLTLDPSMCVNCSSHIYCDTCSNDVNCEYRTRDSKCSAQYRVIVEVTVQTAWVNRGDVFGVLRQKSVFLFSVYTSEYRYGRCREWFDRNNFYDEGEEIPEKLNDHIMCRTCSSFSRCSECLKSWVADGSFLNSSSNEVCAMNKSMSWAYSSCPDVDECALNLHNCHENATCSNYPGSFQCNCNRGFIGDGINECLRTCYEDCVHGKCVNLGYENFKCECDLGWSGVDCSLDCNCHNHSTCYEDIGICDKCMNNTTGKHCHLCKEGSFGNATIGGCDSCFCNGHEKHSSWDFVIMILKVFMEIHDMVENAIILAPQGNISLSLTLEVLGAMEGNLSIEKDCLWIISSASSSRMNLDDKSNTYFSSIPKGFNAISLTIESVNISCSENSIYIYDGLPPYISSSDNFSILGIVCNEKYDMPNKQFIAHSGVISVYFQRPDDLSQGFNASFQVMTCPKEGCDSDNDCPMNCSSIGECHRGVCICPVGFGDIDCSIELPTQTVPIKTTLFLPDIGGHSFRFGHSMDIDLEETLWIYGGSSGNHVLNDIRAFDTRNNSWIRVTVRGEVSPPIGINKTHYLDDFWSFDVITRNWREIKTKENPHSVAGHTLTLNADVARFLLIGAGGLYGHSCIYHEGHFYVYGGISFYVDKVDVSNRLYSLNYDTLQWSLLTSFINVQGGSSPMYFHSAISTPKFMMLIGGNPGAVIAYIYDCQTWVGLDYNLNERYLGLAAVLGDVKRLDIPQDLCRVYDKKSDLCKVTHGCSYCSVYEIVSGTNSSYCYSISSGKEPEECRSFSSGIKESNEGLNCEKIKLSCNFYRVCGECLSKNCRWCSGCNKGQCPKEVTLPEQCPDLICSASDCQKCKTNNSSSECVWTRRVHKSGEQKRKNNKMMIQSHVLHLVTPTTIVTSVYQAQVRKGGWSECRWSIKLNECISPGYLQLRCTGGNCGRILKRGDMCPISCSQRTNCKTCHQRSDCGWCSFSSSPLTGIGVCLQGFSQNILSNSLFSTSSSNKWNIEMCPPENECSNNHHDCDPDSEMCIDTELSYKCVCNEGYEKKVSGEGCKPICSQGCLYGKCIEPGVCKCDFSYVGLDCSKQCQCNGHSDCESPERLDVCISCQNNTIGAHCEKFLQRVSKSIHSGPRDGSETVCVNCEDYTQGRTCEQCVERHFRGTEDTRNDCRPCWCNGHGNTCDQITGENCQCHNNTYSDVHQCRYLRMNLYGRESSCFKYQCSRCKEYYLGYPENGHQCYRVMTVDTEYCFDPETQSECNRIPSPLNAGQAVFFAVQPKFMNVDIRIVIDVTVGEVDVYLAPDSRIFVVENDENWHHNISFDPRFFIFSCIRPFKKRRTSSSTGWTKKIGILGGCFSSFQVYVCTKNITFLKVRHTGRILHAKGLKNRLVISLPEAYHDLRTTRFHIVVIGKVSSKVTFGSMYFRRRSVTYRPFHVRRARRRHEVEMMHMAQRPFTKILILLNQDESSSSSFYVSKKKVGGTCRSRHYHHRRHHNHRKISDQSHNHLRLHMVDCSSNDDEATEESYRIRPVAQEPLIGGSPNINTVLVQYPSGGKKAPNSLKPLTHSSIYGRFSRQGRFQRLVRRRYYPLLNAPVFFKLLDGVMEERHLLEL
ncbi:MEGF8 [Lepeophtheirus salmonis]|uniref:MEGF8 n=1 Tax=Lepeophtheirus salmonis TaxID=72036 RepID=A0A7R8CMW9_LEPSM|nr:MEGF8 [Lepeophtheirus salmonis]CAF2870009.1 MEGF8 [Lepeophtheirus salmonis]